MITMLGILIGGLIVGIIWVCVHFSKEIEELQAKIKWLEGYRLNYNRTTYKSYRETHKHELDSEEENE